jgi:predicted nucleotidyltransferase
VRECLQGAELHRAIARVLAHHFDPRTHRAWIVGSEASGRALPGSDVDVAVEGPVPADLERLARLRDELESLPTLRGFDVVDLHRVGARFRRAALGAAIPLALDDRD